MHGHHSLLYIGCSVTSITVKECSIDAKDYSIAENPNLILKLIVQGEIRKGGTRREELRELLPKDVKTIVIPDLGVEFSGEHSNLICYQLLQRSSEKASQYRNQEVSNGEEEIAAKVKLNLFSI
jgi:hypothetical protein